MSSSSITTDGNATTWSIFSSGDSSDTAGTASATPYDDLPDLTPRAVDAWLAAFRCTQLVLRDRER